MPSEYYRTALKAGKKEVQARLADKLPTELPVLDQILENVDVSGEIPLGLVDIPADLIVGTKTLGRTSAFAPNFMPLLQEDTEFAAKWAHLCDAHIHEGIREPIVCYEYLNKYYVMEGNKRVSVLKFFEADSIPGYVTRIVPARQDTRESRIYYEFLDFYNATSINYLTFSQEGRYRRIAHLVGHRRYERWSPSDRMEFRSCYVRFEEAFEEEGGRKLDLTVGDAMLAYMELFGYQTLQEQTPDEIRENLSKMWEDVKLEQAEETEKAAVLFDPTPEKKPTLVSKILGAGSDIIPAANKKTTGADKDGIIHVAFLYARDPESSSWTYAHELGRIFIQDRFHDKILTTTYDHVTPATAEETIRQAIEDGNTLIFTTTPEFLAASTKASVENPDIKILNCSLDNSSKYLRTYYARMYEGKFLSGVLAGTLTDTGKIGYISNYPIRGMTASINAFALGVKMVNPRARVYLEWSTDKQNQNVNLTEKMYREGITLISHQDMAPPRQTDRQFGLYRISEDGLTNLAFPIWDWGKLYERLLRNIMNGTWATEEKAESGKALNYWWGMSAGVIDVIWSSELPVETRALLDILRENLVNHDFQLFFQNVLYDQEGRKRIDPETQPTTPQDIMRMDWLLSNVIGYIPKASDLVHAAQPVTKLEGIRKEEDDE